MKSPILLCRIDIFMVILLAVCATATRTEDFYEELLSKSNPKYIPAGEGEGPILVDVSVSLVDIREVDVEKNELEVIAWVGTQYRHPVLAWNETGLAYNHVAVPDLSVWLPDLTLYNALKTPEVTMNPGPRVVLYPNGEVFQVKPERLRFSCDLQTVDTSQGSNCSMKFGSWVYNGYSLDFKEPRDLDLMDYIRNPSYEMISTNASKQVVFYPCCPGPYPEAVFSFGIRKRSNDWFSSISKYV